MRYKDVRKANKTNKRYRHDWRKVYELEAVRVTALGCKQRGRRRWFFQIACPRKLTKREESEAIKAVEADIVSVSNYSPLFDIEFCTR